MLPLPDFIIRQGSTSPELLVSVAADGRPVDWVPGTTATFHMTSYDAYGALSQRVINDAPAIAQNNGQGKLLIGFNFNSSQTLTPGTYASTWKVSVGGAAPAEWPVNNQGEPNFIIQIIPTLSP